MQNKSKLTLIIEKANQENRLARIPYLTAGCPGKESFWTTLEELAENGCDVLEIGVPFTDPVADGPVVALAAQRSLELEVDLDYIFDGLEKRKEKFANKGLVLMGYANPFLQYAWNKIETKLGQIEVEKISKQSLKLLFKRANEAGVDGLIIPDLPLNEADIWREASNKYNIDIIALVGPNTSEKRMHQYAEFARGYVYVVSLLGTTGIRDNLPIEAKDTLMRAHKTFTLPLALGFGLKGPEQLSSLSKEEKPEAVVFGSSLINHLNNGGSAKEYMKNWLK